MMRLKMWMLVAAVGFAAVASGASADDADKCGKKGQKPCPMQGWMEDHVQVPMEKGDYKKVAEALEKVAKMAPDPKWNEGDKGWAKLAKENAEVAKKGELRPLKKACKTCHKAWRKEYKKKFQLKPVPKV